MNIRKFSFLLVFLLTGIITLCFAQGDTLFLSLEDALNLATKNSPTSAEISIDKRSGLLSLAGGVSQILPTPSLSADYTKSKSSITNQFPANYNKSFSGSLIINQTVFDPDVYGNLYKSKLYYDYYKLQAKDKTANLIYSVKVSYYSLAKIYNLFEVAKASSQRADDNYKLNQEKFRLGQITKFDVLRSETFKTQAEIDLLTAEKNLKVSIEDLKGELGIDDNIMIKPTTTPTIPNLDIDFESIFADIFEQNPTLQSSQKYKSISKTSFTQSIANILPSLNLFWSSSFSDTNMLKNVSDWRNKDVVSYGVKLNFPIFEIKSYLLNIGSSRNELRRAYVQMKKAEILLRKNATNAIYTFKESKERYTYASKNLELNQELLRLAQEEYRLGAITQLDLFNTEINFNTAQNTYFGALYDAYTSYAMIEYLLGISELNNK
jgi:outer membrane protein TolC